MKNNFTVNFDDIGDFLDNYFFDNPKSKEIIEKAGLNKSQIEIINTLILMALKAYDLQKHQ